MRKHHLILASLIVVTAHIGALLAIARFKSTPLPVIKPPVLQAAVIALPAPEIEKPAEPVKTPPPPVKKEKVVQTKPKNIPVAQPEKVIAVEQAAAVTDNTLAAAPAPEPTPEIAAPEPVFEPPRVDARNKDNPPPTYPRIARKLGQEGTVLLEIYILADGSVGEVRLKKTSGFSRLDEAAIAAAKSWHYLPATQDGKSISFWYEHAVKFVLN